jgi:hypothetical protein
MNVDDLEAFIDESIRVSAKNGYFPTVFQGMRARHTTVGAIEKLVVSGELQTGFKRLQELGLAKDWSIEAAVLKFPEKFSKDAIECARFRLDEVSKSSGT